MEKSKVWGISGGGIEKAGVVVIAWVEVVVLP